MEVRVVWCLVVAVMAGWGSRDVRCVFAGVVMGRPSVGLRSMGWDRVCEDMLEGGGVSKPA